MSSSERLAERERWASWRGDGVTASVCGVSLARAGGGCWKDHLSLGSGC